MSNHKSFEGPLYSGVYDGQINLDSPSALQNALNCCQLDDHLASVFVHFHGHIQVNPKFSIKPNFSAHFVEEDFRDQ
jgi:hypothetical protein